jgi:hypothetical protein
MKERTKIKTKVIWSKTKGIKRAMLKKWNLNKKMKLSEEAQ